MNENIVWKNVKLHLAHRIGLRRTITFKLLVADGLGGYYAYQSDDKRIHISREMIVGIEQRKTSVKDGFPMTVKIVGGTAALFAVCWGLWGYILMLCWG